MKQSTAGLTDPENRIHALNFPPDVPQGSAWGAGNSKISVFSTNPNGRPLEAPAAWAWCSPWTSAVRGEDLRNKFPQAKSHSHHIPQNPPWSPFVRCKSVAIPGWSIHGQFAVKSCVVNKPIQKTFS